jgi:outer membrane protein assembly factor BamA
MDAPHPNTVPYESQRSVAYHVLASPAYLLHGLTRPIGWTLLYLERNYPNLFEPQPRRRGVLPLFELGGPVGATAGVVLYDNHLFGSAHRARFEGMFGARDFFELEARYEMPRPFGPHTRFSLEGNFFSEPQDRFFIDGAGSDLQTDEARFSRQQVDVRTRLEYGTDDTAFDGAVGILYEHIDASTADGPEGERLVGRAGLTTVDLLTSSIELGLDLTRGTKRTYAGTEVLLRLDYTHDLNGDRFRYGRYAVAVHQYVPVFLFPKTRRLALRAYLEQVEPILGGDTVPFYQLPRLGGQRSLRGFVSDRFQGDGALLFTAEYRYPIWDTRNPAGGGLDAVFFVDTGQVFESFRAVAVNDFRTAVGGGFHLLNSRGLSARFEVARSVESTRIILTVRPTFGRSPR